MAWSIRPAVQDEALALAELVRLLAAEQGETSAVDEVFTRRYLATPGFGAFLAEEDGGIIGMLAWSVRPNLYHAAPCLAIEELIVAPACRGRGVGRDLVEAAVVLAQSSRCAEISVSTGLDNRAAQALYRGMGLNDEALLMEKHF